MQIIVGAAIVLAGLYFFSKGKEERSGDSGAILPMGGGPSPFIFDSGQAKPGGVTQLVAARVGNALSAATGIPGFDKAGVAIANMFGRGRRQADDLGQHYQNPLKEEFARIIESWNYALQSGRATRATAEQAKQMLRAAADNFYEIARQPKFDRAGPGGIQTIRHVVEDILIPDIDRAMSTRGLR